MLEYAITNEPNQDFVISYENEQIEVNLEFITTKSFWVMSIIYKGKEYNGIRLNSAVTAFDTYNLPFDVFINDVNNIGFDAFDINNFKSGFYTFNLIEREELAEARGYDVE